MNDALVLGLEMNVFYGKPQLEGITAEQAVARPHPAMSHPAWLVGHILYAEDFGIQLLGGESVLPEGWDALFGRGAEPKDDPSIYPAWEELLHLYGVVHDRLAELLPGATAETLAAPMPVEELRETFPTIGVFVQLVVTNHEAAHLGQLAAWRAAMGLPVTF